MATDEADARAPDRDESSGSSSDSDDDNESGSGQNSSVEWLATGRAKRSTAGNRMKAMLANEEPAAEDSDLELLFAEDEDDAGFTDEGKDDASDVQMDSSSDEEDAAPGKDDEMEGEKELQRKEREKKAADRKRKAQEAIPAKFRKKVRIDQPPAASGPSRGEAAAAAAAAPQPRPKKKSERLSWLPSVADAPTRASERATTRSSKEHLHQQMIEREKKRKKQLEMMEKKAKRLEALKKPPMTQQDRLAEAAIVEKRNSKSLNRWEEAEKQREEERAAKLAAMYNRKLEGPVVTFWSGILELSEGEMKHVGRMVTMEEKAPRKKRQSAAATLAAQEAAAAKSADQPEKPSGVADGTAEPKEPKTETQGNMEKTPSAQDQPATASTTATEGPAASLASQPHPPPSASESVKGNETQPGLAAPDVYLTEAVFMPIGPPLSDPKPSEPPPSLETSQPLPDAAPPPTQTPTPPPPPLPTASIQHTPEVNQPLSSGLAAPTSLLAPPAATAPSLPPPRPAGTTLPFNVLAAPSTIHGPSPLSQPPLTPSGALSVPMMAPPPPPPPLPPPSPIPPPAAVQQLETKVPDIPVSENKAPETKAPEIKMSETPAPESAMPATEALETRASESAVPESKAPEAGVLGIATSESKAPESRAVESTTTTPQSPAAPLKEPETPKLPETPSDTRITRSCIMLQNFDEEAIQDRQVQTQILFGRRMGKVGRLQKPGHAPHCVITNRVARYRDPLTGLPFYNAQAYKEIQKLHRGEYKWSSLVGAWVGAGTLAARGVPQGFLGGPREKVPEVLKPKADPERKDEKAKESSSAEVEPKVEPKVEPLQAQSAVSSQSQQQQQPQQQPQQAPQPQLQQPLPAAPAAAP